MRMPTYEEHYEDPEGEVCEEHHQKGRSLVSQLLVMVVSTPTAATLTTISARFGVIKNRERFLRAQKARSPDP